jgi:hypothetical protein
MYQTAPLVAGTSVLGLTVARETPLADSAVGRSALAVTGMSIAAYVAVALVLITVGLVLRLRSRVAGE